MHFCAHLWPSVAKLSFPLSKFRFHFFLGKTFDIVLETHWDILRLELHRWKGGKDLTSSTQRERRQRSSFKSPSEQFPAKSRLGLSSSTTTSSNLVLSPSNCAKTHVYFSSATRKTFFFLWMWTSRWQKYRGSRSLTITSSESSDSLPLLLSKVWVSSV